MNRKILFILIGVVMLISSMGMAFAEESAGANFADMPDNWSTDALQKAVSNGLLGGYVEAGKQLIKADSSLTCECQRKCLPLDSELVYQQ